MNELNVLKRICRHLFLAVLLCAVSAATASAQVPTVTVDAKNVTIKELLQRIEANSQYTFAYIDADISTPDQTGVGEGRQPQHRLDHRRGASQCEYGS